MARRRKPAKKRRGKGSTDSSSSIHNSVSSEHVEAEHSPAASGDADPANCAVIQVDTEAKLRRNGVGSEKGGGEGDREEALLRLPEMKDSSMDTVGQPLCDVMDRLNGALDKEEDWGHAEEAGETSEEASSNGAEPPAQQPFRKASQSEPPDRSPGEETAPPNPDLQQASAESTDARSFTPFGPDAAASGGGHADFTEHGQPQTLPGGGGEGEAPAAAGRESDLKEWEQGTEAGQEKENASADGGKEEGDKLSPSESSHPAEFR